ncbi:hypothetical protein ACE10Z_01120 [Bradyrhizobium sp. Pha-3]|uniref:hypothetical protein n=1 Tax=Bradyrhizobium sp. Pha-3 TaxID=208375 RepID=UPI0035D3DFEB
MGALIPNPNDIEIVNKLNNRFGPAGLAALRSFMAGHNDDTFKASRHLHRISLRLGIFPTSGPMPRARWFKFLRDLLGKTVPTNPAKIQKTIRDGVNDWNTTTNPPSGCVGIKFWAIYDPQLSQDYRVDVYQAPPDLAGQYWITITLVCQHEIDGAEPGIPDPTNADPGESGTPPPPPSLAPKAKRPGKNAAKKPSGAKKAANKAAKKAAKKSAKKAGADSGS